MTRLLRFLCLFTLQTAVVQTGRTTSLHFRLPVGVLRQSVQAAEAAPLISYHRHGVEGVVSRLQIENLPLNGREFLQLAILQPGVMADPGAGAVNIVTRSGGNRYHGSAFFFFRDHNLAAYPALERDPLASDPFFARRQAGFCFGGPLRRDRLFFFANFENNNQDSVVGVQPRSPAFAAFGGIFPNDYLSRQASLRLDWRVHGVHNAFLRYSHDGNDGLIPPTAQGSLPSNWSGDSNWADQSLASLVSALRPNLVNEVRFSYWPRRTPAGPHPGELPRRFRRSPHPAALPLRARPPEQYLEIPHPGHLAAPPPLHAQLRHRLLLLRQPGQPRPLQATLPRAPARTRRPGPRGNGRFLIDGSLIPNPYPNIPGVSLLRPLDFRSAPTNFRGAHLLAILPLVRGLLEQQLGDPGNTDLSVRNIDVFKQGRGLTAPDFATPYSLHTSLGFQRRLPGRLVLTADLVLRRSLRQNMGDVDLNRWNHARGSVIPACSGLEALDPAVYCSTGPIGVQLSGGHSRYKGLLLRLDRRFSRGFQFLASCALASYTGLNGIVNNDQWFESYGPLPGDRRHILTLSGILDLPPGLRASFISTATSRPPFTARLYGLDLNGDGTSNDALPGAGWNRLNRGLDEAGLVALVAAFNRDYAGKTTPRNQFIPPVTLPSRFRFGDTLVSQDLRLGRTFSFRDQFSLTLSAEVFNLFNVANLSGHSFNLYDPAAFSRSARRITQVFGSGGPRAFQLGVRLNWGQ